MLLVDDDEADVFERGENGRAGSDDDAGVAVVDAVPFVVPLALREMAVQDGDAGLRGGETALESLHGLRRERNLRNKHDGGFAETEHFLDGLQINLGLAAAGDAVEQDRLVRFRLPDGGAHFVKHLDLLRIEREF